MMQKDKEIIDQHKKLFNQFKDKNLIFENL